MSRKREPPRRPASSAASARSLSAAARAWTRRPGHGLRSRSAARTDARSSRPWTSSVGVTTVVGGPSPPRGKFRHVSAGGAHTCAISADQKLVCWGSNDFGEATPPGGEYFRVSSGVNHSCAITTGGAITCWGDSPGSPPAGAFTDVAAGVRLDCALEARTNLAKCWGEAAAIQSRPANGELRVIVVGGAHACAIAATGAAGCNGANEKGQATPPTGTFKEVSAGLTHSCAIRADDTIVCWGRAGAAEQAPQPPAGTFSQLTSYAGGGHNCALRLSDKGIECWN